MLWCLASCFKPVNRKQWAGCPGQGRSDPERSVHRLSCSKRVQWQPSAPVQRGGVLQPKLHQKPFLTVIFLPVIVFTCLLKCFCLKYRLWEVITILSEVVGFFILAKYLCSECRAISATLFRKRKAITSICIPLTNTLNAAQLMSFRLEKIAV